MARCISGGSDAMLGLEELCGRMEASSSDVEAGVVFLSAPDAMPLGIESTGLDPSPMARRERSVQAMFAVTEW